MLASLQPEVIVTSSEPKAMETAEIVSKHIGKNLEVGEGLHEHDRSNVTFLSAGEFQTAVADFFMHPQKLVFGKETAEQAQQRFAKAIEQVLGKHSRGNVVVVAHGTVIALFIADCVNAEPFPLWQRLGLPSYIILSIPDFRVLDIVEKVTSDE
jgi:broad specificity phosphatase PhoE